MSKLNMLSQLYRTLCPVAYCSPACGRSHRADHSWFTIRPVQFHKKHQPYGAHMP